MAEHGNDQLFGGVGVDQFLFVGNFGADIIGDFKAGAGIKDQIMFSTAIVDSFAEILAATKNVSGDAVITFAGVGSITLDGVTKAMLVADDFAFF